MHRHVKIFPRSSDAVGHHVAEKKAKSALRNQASPFGDDVTLEVPCQRLVRFVMSIDELPEQPFRSI